MVGEQVLDIGTLFNKMLLGLRSWWVNKDIETSLSKMLFGLRSWCVNKCWSPGWVGSKIGNEQTEESSGDVAHLQQPGGCEGQQQWTWRGWSFIAGYLVGCRQGGREQDQVFRFDFDYDFQVLEHIEEAFSHVLFHSYH